MIRFSPPHKQLGDWGLGIGLYFSTLRAITVLTLLAGLLNIPNLMYFSRDYSDDQPGLRSVLLRGSAVCTDTGWVVCRGDDSNNNDTSCTSGNFEDNRFATGYKIDNNDNNITASTATFALRNFCEGATIQTGMVNFSTLIFVLLGIVLLSLYLRHMEIALTKTNKPPKTIPSSLRIHPVMLQVRLSSGLIIIHVLWCF